MLYLIVNGMVKTKLAIFPFFCSGEIVKKSQKPYTLFCSRSYIPVFNGSQPILLGKGGCPTFIVMWLTLVAMHCVQTVQTVIVADPISEWTLIRITHLIWRKILKIEKNWILIQLLGHVKQAEEAGLSVTGFWIQDYSGQITTVFGQRVFWNWCWDPEHYPSRRFSYNFLHLIDFCQNRCVVSTL